MASTPSRPSTGYTDTTTKRPIADILAQTLPSFDHQAKIVAPFNDESKRDIEFVKQLNAMLLELMLDFHAWAAARPAHLSDKTEEVLEKELGELVDIEKEQGTCSRSVTLPLPSASRSLVEATRQRLNEFVTRIKLALAALTALAP